MKNFNRFVLAAVVLVGLLWGPALAGNTGHYPLGSEGIKAATLPPPGLYLRTYSSYFTAGDLIDDHGKDSGADFNVSSFAVVPRLIWMTDKKILGADYGMDMLIPFVCVDFELGGVQSNNDMCYGDICIEPVDLAWHGDNYDIGAALAVWIPTGKYNVSNPASPGKDFWSTMFTLGGTYYLDPEKTWSASILSRYEIHSTKDHTEDRPGNNLLFEWGVAKSYAKGCDIGLVGYNQWQLTDDKGADSDTGVHDRIAAIGPEISVFVPTCKAFVSLRALREFSAIDRPEGTTVTLTVTKIF